MNKQDIKNKILLDLAPLSLKESIEIVANVLIELGIEKIDIEEKTDKINVKNVYNIVLNDLKKHGDTLPNSLARQGLTMLMWLNK